MLSTTELIEKAIEQQPIVRDRIAEIKAELDLCSPEVTEGGRVILEGEAARKVLEELLGGLIAADGVYDYIKSELAN